MRGLAQSSEPLFELRIKAKRQSVLLPDSYLMIENNSSCALQTRSLSGEVNG